MQSTQLTPFCFGDHLVRVFTDDSGDPWWMAKDVCKVLDIENVGNVLAALDEDERIIIHNSDGNPRAGIPHQYALISESGLYALVFRSRKPEAKAFSKWVRSEVLPAIRKTGRYEKPGRKAAEIELPAEMPMEALALKPAMRQKLMRDAIRLASLDSGDSASAVHWFGELCKTIAAAPPAPASGEDKVRAFYYQCCQPAPGVKTRSETLYEAFRRWHSDQKGDLPSKKVFGSCMKEFARYCRSNGSAFEGIRLK